MKNRIFASYPDDADYTTNANSYYDDLARKQKLIQLLSKKIWQYENTLNETLEEIQTRLTNYISQNDALMSERLENWDKRIDEMPEEMKSLFITWLNDGTLEQIINHDVLGNKADQSELDKTNQQLAENTNNYTKFKYPDELTILEEFKIDLFKYGKGYNTNFDIKTKRIKNGGATYYVSPSGDDSNTGLEMGIPLKGIDTAIAKTDVETIVLLPGDYYLKQNFTKQIVVNKSINIIGKGKVRIIIGERYTTWEDHPTELNTKVLNPIPPNFGKVISLKHFNENGDELELNRKLSTTTDVHNIPFSYSRVESGGVFVHPLKGDDMKDIAVLSNAAIPFLVTDSVNAKQIKLYIENIHILGGSEPFKSETVVTQSLDNFVYANNCKFMHSTGGNGFSVVGGNAMLVDCVASYNHRDGFNYHYNTSAKIPNFVEINCIARNNGKSGASNNNGSTNHDGGQGIRVNGEYYGSEGGNVADISANTRAVNLNCKAHNSRATVDPTYNANFTAHSGAKLWVYDCLSYGSEYDFRIEQNATIYAKNNQLLVGANMKTGTLVEE